MKKLALALASTLATVALQISGYHNRHIAGLLLLGAVASWMWWLISHDALLKWCKEREKMALWIAIIVGGLVGCGIGAAWWVFQVRHHNASERPLVKQVKPNEGLWLTITDTSTAAGGSFLSVQGLLNNSTDRQVAVTSLDLMYRNHLHGIGNPPQWKGLVLRNRSRTPLPIVIDARKSVSFVVKGN
jgi:hypothetical protein